jgi:uncharacterized protein (DUF342 family)
MKFERVANKSNYSPSTYKPYKPYTKEQEEAAKQVKKLDGVIGKLESQQKLMARHPEYNKDEALEKRLNETVKSLDKQREHIGWDLPVYSSKDMTKYQIHAIADMVVKSFGFVEVAWPDDLPEHSGKTEW